MPTISAFSFTLCYILFGIENRTKIYKKRPGLAHILKKIHKIEAFNFYLIYIDNLCTQFYFNYRVQKLKCQIEVNLFKLLKGFFHNFFLKMNHRVFFSFDVEEAAFVKFSYLGRLSLLKVKVKWKWNQRKRSAIIRPVVDVIKLFLEEIWKI